MSPVNDDHDVPETTTRLVKHLPNPMVTSRKGQGVFALSQIADGVLNNLLQVRGTEISVSFLRAVRKSSFTRNDDHIITYLT